MTSHERPLRYGDKRLCNPFIHSAALPPGGYQTPNIYSDAANSNTRRLGDQTGDAQNTHHTTTILLAQRVSEPQSFPSEYPISSPAR